MSRYSKINFIYRLQRWMDSVPGKTFMNYAYSWGAAVVILGTLFKLTHLPGANLMLFLGMGTEVFVFFIAAFDRPFDKTEDGKELMTQSDLDREDSALASGGTVVIGGGVIGGAPSEVTMTSASTSGSASGGGIVTGGGGLSVIPTTPAPAVSQETAEKMEEVTTAYVDHLTELNEILEKVALLSKRLTTDSEEMENLNRTLTGISRVYEMQLKSASQQIGTQDEINERQKKMAAQIEELNQIYTRMIEAMKANH